MDELKIIGLEINKPIQFVNNKKFFEGKIIKLQDKFIGVMISTFQDNVKIFNINEIVNFFIVFEEAAYWCNSSVIGCKAEDYAQLVLLDHPKVINKIERRRSPRVSIVVDIEYCFLPDGVDKKSKVTQGHLRGKRKTFTIDISGGGIAIITYEKIESGSLIFLSFNIKENITTVCSVVRSEEYDGNRNFKTALKFIDIDVSHWNIIMEYVNEKIKKQWK